jgi:hypothetical protein
MTVIREAVIRLRLEQQKTNLNAPDIRVIQEAEKTTREIAKATDAWAAGLRKVNEEWRKGGSGRDRWAEGITRMSAQRADAAQKAADAERAAVQESIRQQKELERMTALANRQMLIAFREGGEGALRMARGIAFLSASGGQSVSMAQGAFDVFAGGTKLITNLSAVLGPVPATIAAVTTALGAGAIAWRAYADEEARAARFAEEFRKKSDEAIAAGDRAARMLGGEASRGAALRDIDRQIAEAGGREEVRRGLREGIVNIEQQRAEAQERERQARERYRYFADVSGGAERGRFIAPVEAAEREQLDLLKERVQRERDIHQAQLDEFDERERRLRETLANVRAADIPILSDLTAAGVQGQVEQVRRERDQVTAEFQTFMRDLLKTVREQQTQVNEVQREQDQIRAGAAAR